MKKIKINLFVVVAIILLGYIVYSKGWLNLPFATVPTGSAFENCLWQPDNCWASCQLNLYQSPTQPVPASEAVQCPLSADVGYCTIQSFSSGCSYDSAITYTSCSRGLLNIWSCSGQINSFNPGSSGDSTRFDRGQWILFNRPIPCLQSSSLSIKIYKQELRRCGTSACPSGSGQIITSADGCSWNPSIAGYKWEDGTSNAKEIPLGQSYPYVCSQHLLSCPSPCTDDLACSVPSQSLKTFKIFYNNKYYNAYVANSMTNIIGCKASSQYGCTKYDSGTNSCLEYGNVESSSCGTIATWNVGQCALESDCGRTDYTCKFDTATGTGQCIPRSTYTPSCVYDYDCTQTGSQCIDKIFRTPKCVSGSCAVNQTNVECCFGYDCQSGYFCNSQNKCEKSQTVVNDCPFECCINEENYKNKLCTGANKFCCPSGTDFGGVCKSDQEACTSTVGPQIPNLFDWIKKTFNLDALAKMLGLGADILTWIILAVIVILALWIFSKISGGRGGTGSTIIIQK